MLYINLYIVIYMFFFYLYHCIVYRYKFEGKFNFRVASLSLNNSIWTFHAKLSYNYTVLLLFPLIF